MELLNLHPNLHCHGEIYSPTEMLYRGSNWFSRKKSSSLLLSVRIAFPLSVLRIVWASGTGAEVVGFKLFPDQSKDVWTEVLNSASTKKILLSRENILRRELSYQIATKTGQWVQFSDDSERQRIKFDLDAFWRRIEIGQQHEAELFKKLKISGQDYLRVTYENLTCKYTELEVNRIYDFLGLDSCNSGIEDVKLKRQNSSAFEELVTNFKEIDDSLSGTEYAWMIKGQRCC